MFGLPNEQAREIIKGKEIEAKILASRPESDRVAAPAARLSRRAWLLIALACVAIIAGVFLAILL